MRNKTNKRCNKITQAFRLRPSLVALLNKESAKTKINKTKLVEQALMRLFGYQ